MAAADTFKITVRGRTTHGSAPHEGVDAVWVASQLVGALQGIAAREIDARRPTVVSVGSLHAGNRINIIAGEAELTGTVRTLDPASREHVEAADAAVRYSLVLVAAAALIPAALLLTAGCRPYRETVARLRG